MPLGSARLLPADGAIVAADGSLVLTGGLTAAGATLTPGGIDVAGPAGFDNNVSVGQDLFVTRNLIAAWDTVAVSGAAVADLASTATFPPDGTRIEFEGEIIGPAGTFTWVLQPNTTSANQTGNVDGVASDTGAYTENGVATLKISTSGGAAARVQFSGWITQGDDLQREYFCAVTHVEGGVTFTQVVQGVWQVTTTISGLRLHTVAGSGLADGTTLRTRAG